MQAANTILGATYRYFLLLPRLSGSQISPAVALGCLSSVKFGLVAHRNSRVHGVCETRLAIGPYSGRVKAEGCRYAIKLYAKMIKHRP